MKKQISIALRSSLIFWGSWSGALAREPLPCAPQVGPSCAFFGNVPALTLHSGVDIAQSLEFIRPIYGLHRGDFRFQAAFQKKKFFELFSIPYTVHEIDHPKASERELLLIVEKIITETFDAGLQKGHTYSLRSIGAFGGPHNTLLVAKNGEKYQVHDPFSGVIRSLSRAQLAEKILVRTSKSKHELQARYLTHFLTIAPTPSKPLAIRALKDLPGTLKIALTPSQRNAIKQALQPVQAVVPDQTITDVTKVFPALDFAMLPAAKEGDKPVSVIRSTQKAEELYGLIRLGQFHLNVWQLGNRDRLPVLFLRGKPHALVGYRTDKLGLVLQWYNGISPSELYAREALAAMLQEEILFATMPLAHETK